MEVILLEDISSLGGMGDLVRVSDGYARNYLLPRKKAVVATAAGRQALEQARRLAEQRKVRLEQEAHKLAERIAQVTCTIYKPAGEGGKLFGSVTSADIEAALREQGIVVDRKKIVLDEPIRHTGAHTVSLKLYTNVVAQLNVLVEKE